MASCSSLIGFISAPLTNGVFRRLFSVFAHRCRLDRLHSGNGLQGADRVLFRLAVETAKGGYLLVHREASAPKAIGDLVCPMQFGVRQLNAESLLHRVYTARTRPAPTSVLRKGRRLAFCV